MNLLAHKLYNKTYITSHAPKQLAGFQCWYLSAGIIPIKISCLFSININGIDVGTKMCSLSDLRKIRSEWEKNGFCRISLPKNSGA